MPEHIYIDEARHLFSAFANRHGLKFVEEVGAPVQLLWQFPVQDGLSHTLTLGLQNCDELNLGIDDIFWSYWFPFLEVADRFIEILDSWMAGRARVVVTCKRGRELQLIDGQHWRRAYGENRIWAFRGTPKAIIQNNVYPTISSGLKK